MTDVGSTRWTLVAEFDPLDVQEQADPELGFPNDEASQFVGFLAESWGGLPEELAEDVDFTATKVTVIFEYLHEIELPLDKLLAHTMPRSITLTRNAERR